MSYDDAVGVRESLPHIPHIPLLPKSQDEKGEERKTKETKTNEKRTNPKTKTNARAPAVAAIGTGTGTGVARRGKRSEDRAKRARTRKAEVQVAELEAHVSDLLAQIKAGCVMQNEDPGAKDQGGQFGLLVMAVTTAKSSAAAGREATQRARGDEAKWKARAGVWELGRAVQDGRSRAGADEEWSSRAQSGRDADAGGGDVESKGRGKGGGGYGDGGGEKVGEISGCKGRAGQDESSGSRSEGKGKRGEREGRLEG